VRSDIARKRRFGVDPTEHLPEIAYSAAVTIAVYEELARSARQIARSGHVAVVDAVFATDALRQSIRDAATLESVSFVGLWLDAPVEIMEARLAARGADASDADAAVLRQQLSHTSVPVGWERIDASVSIDRVADAALRRTTQQIEVDGDRQRAGLPESS
jgi:predicted kinase